MNLSHLVLRADSLFIDLLVVADEGFTSPLANTKFLYAIPL